MTRKRLDTQAMDPEMVQSVCSFALENPGHELSKKHHEEMTPDEFVEAYAHWHGGLTGRQALRVVRAADEAALRVRQRAVTVEMEIAALRADAASLASVFVDSIRGDGEPPWPVAEERELEGCLAQIQDLYDELRQIAPESEYLTR